MSESIQQHAILDDIDEDTFLRFCEFAYTSDYPVPSAKVFENHLNTQEANADGNVKQSEFTGRESQILSRKTSNEDLSPSKSNGPVCSTTKSIIRRPFLTFSKPKKTVVKRTNNNVHHIGWSGCVVPESDSKIGIAWQRFSKSTSEYGPRPSLWVPRNTPTESWEGIFVCHAKLYVLGDRYMIEDLRSLALYKLRRTLASVVMYPCLIPEILSLVQYSYENTREADALRDLLTDYALCKVTYLLAYEGWNTFIREESTFALELLAKLKTLENK